MQLPALNYHTELALYNFPNARKFIEIVDGHLATNFTKIKNGEPICIHYTSNSCPYVKMNGCIDRLLGIMCERSNFGAKCETAIYTFPSFDIASIISSFCDYGYHYTQKFMTFSTISDKRRENIMRRKVLRHAVETYQFLDLFIEASFYEEPRNGTLFLMGDTG